MTPISALLIIKNEEAFLERTLSSLLWCDEIVVVDSFSTDRSPAICQRADAPWASKIKFFQKEWLGFSTQRNYALLQAKHDWVFFLDGDETCSPDLIREIQKILAQPDGPGHFQFKIRRQEFFLKKPIHYGIWNPSYHIRFFNRQGVHFVGDVHEGVKSEYETKKIEAPIIHVEDLKMERFLSKLNHYTTLQAKNDYERGLRTGYVKIALAFPAMVYKNFIYYRGYKDGHEGLIISVLEGISRTVRHLKIWQIQYENSLGEKNK
jgi:glycosyltransferase involved in cell wall biosynthesis